MKINEVPHQPTTKTPDQARIDALKQAKDRAGDALKAERNRQKLEKAKAQISKISSSSV